MATTKKEFRDQTLQTRNDDHARLDRTITKFRIEDTIKSILQERGVMIKTLASNLGVTRSALCAWMRSPYWASDPLALHFNQWSGKDLFQLALIGGLTYNPPKSPGRTASNLAERDKYLPKTFGYVLFDYLTKNNMSVAELEDQLGCYRNQLHYIAKRKLKMKDLLYQKLCLVSDTFTRFFPWTLRQPELEEHDIKMRDLVMIYYVDILELEREFIKHKTKAHQDLCLDLFKKSNA